MSSARERLKKLLDGDLEASDIAEDASLVSLADRLYGIKIANVKPVKARDMDGQGSDLPQPGEQQFGQTSSLMVEVIEPASMPLPNLAHLEMPDLPNNKKNSSLFSLLSLGGLIIVILNLFGLFSSIFEGSCKIGECRSEGQTRINLMDFYKFGESDGWSYSLLTDSMSGVGGTTGGIGIPDIVALISLSLVFLFLRKK
ncbi:MAG TPA: hypothetical protein HA359_01400 [Candidatus Poseidoniaceae archaeon]|nr:MAG TPA: hypothetical protein D7H84_01400 [Candidatus Poseidoniales archaeon]DAC58130.1 MAG TPA: hypothetical protein D7I03_06225 [Candidatus Poseidoniales archaeon]HII22893.1 hypothetical protein [Candidatus Poseidoniaceae archaeon]HII50921.1 hypothetical protein [Candidatus Poseidoniaceae archaeon]